MLKEKLDSAFVRRAMLNATEGEIESATRRWFDYLHTLNRLLEDEEKAKADSLESLSDGRFE